MSKRLIRMLVKKVKPGSGQLSAVHVDAVLRLAEQADSGKSVQLPGGVEVRRHRDSLLFRAMKHNANAKSQTTPRAFSHAIELGRQQAEVSLMEQSCRLRFRVIDWHAEGGETSTTGAVLDRERLRVPLVVRNWQPGDFMQPLGHQKRHKLSRLLNELGVSRWEKVSWPVLTSGNKIVWARGLPVAVEFATGDTTREGVLITEVASS